jgi:hypothetical protein
MHQFLQRNHSISEAGMLELVCLRTFRNQDNTYPVPQLEGACNGLLHMHNHNPAFVHGDIKAVSHLYLLNVCFRKSRRPIV